MGAVKALYTDIQIALDKADRLTLQYIMHTHANEDGDRGWIVDGVLATKGQWMYNDPEDGWDQLAWTAVELEQRREAIEVAFLIGGEWYGSDDKLICHDCAHFLSDVMGVPLDAEEPECDCGRHEERLSLTSRPPETLPMAVNPLRCPCGSLLAVRMFEMDINLAVSRGELSDIGALWYRTVNRELGFSGYLADPEPEDAPAESEVTE